MQTVAFGSKNMNSNKGLRYQTAKGSLKLPSALLPGRSALIRLPLLLSADIQIGAATRDNYSNLQATRSTVLIMDIEKRDYLFSFPPLATPHPQCLHVRAHTPLRFLRPSRQHNRG